MIKIPTSEAESEYDGVLSYSSEYHVSIAGFANGLVLGWNSKLRNELLNESSYFLFFLFVGWILAYLISGENKNDKKTAQK